MLLAGFGETLKDLPIDMYWASYMSYMKYGFEGLMAAIYGFDRPIIHCPDGEYCHYRNPKKFIKDMLIHADQFWTDILGLCVIFIFLRIMAFIILRFKIARV